MYRKVLVVYYTQTGQLFEIVKSITNSLQVNGDIDVVFEELKPKSPFPFPWSSNEFFQAFPESVKGIPCELESFTVSPDEPFDLVIIAYQSWFLSPSIPFHAFFQHESTKRLLAGKPVITVIGCRNMWVMAHENMKQYIREANGRLIGNIVLRDKAANLLSVVTIIRWMMKGKKDRYLRIFPPAGISHSDIEGAAIFGNIIYLSMQHGNFDNLRNDLFDAGAVTVQPELIMLEKRGKIFFNFWADFALKKGSYGSKSRNFRLILFKYYLLTVLFLVSPFATLAFYLTKPFRYRSIQKQIMMFR